MLGTTPRTLRQWESTGELIPSRKTKGGTRYYAVNDLLAVRDENAPTIGYARVSGHRQKDDLKRQQEMLETYGAAKGWRMEVITDLGSGLNYRKAGLQRLLELIMRRRMRRLVLTHKDRLLRFGAELVFALCEEQDIEIVIIHQGDPACFLKKNWRRTCWKFITVFSARLYGSRSKKHRALLETLTDTEVAREARQLSRLG